VKLTDEQKEQFRHYYDVNKLLIDYMANGTVSDAVRQKVEQTLFLPIGDSEENKQRE